MLLVGHFLSILLKDNVLPQRCSTLNVPQHHLVDPQPLYSCLTYSQMDFICLILKIFSGLPESYQVLRCQTTTTMEELSLFEKRVENLHAHFLVLDFNKLPFKLQEVSELQSMNNMCMQFNYYRSLSKFIWGSRKTYTKMLPLSSIL